MSTATNSRNVDALGKTTPCKVCREITYFPCPDGVCPRCVMQLRCEHCNADDADAAKAASTN